MRVCDHLGKSRAAFYKRSRREGRMELERGLVHDLVLKHRRVMPRLGGRKLFHLIKPELEAHGVKLGRDRFFDWLRAEHLLVRPKKRYVKTTHSHHRFRRYTNLIKEVSITRADQVWVSDITYLRLRKGFCYMSLITDAYSRKIIGYDISDTLELTGCIRALKMGCRQRTNTAGIHHSDRGIQYCSTRYTNLLKQQGIKISMAEAGNCYENALAERMNGILKNEFNLDATFENLGQARRQSVQAIEIYNTKRPHMALEMSRPCDLYKSYYS